MPSTNNVLVGKPLVTGGILTAPVGTKLPTDESTALDSAFVANGYATDDGATQGESRDTDTIYAWGGTPLVTVLKSTTVTMKFGFAEFLNPTVQALIYGDQNVMSTPATSSKGAAMKISVGSAPCPHRAWAFEMSPGTDAKVRIIIPDGQISDTDDVEYKDDGIASRGVTVTAFPDAQGNFAYIYTNDGVKTVTP